MEIFGLFIHRLRNLRRIRDLQQFSDSEQQWENLPHSGTYMNNPGIEQQKIPGLTAYAGISSSSLGVLVSQKQTYSHLATKAAISHWRYNKSPIKIAMSYGQAAKSIAAKG